MANQKISELSAITVIDDADVLPIVDSIATETKKISVTQIKGLAPVQSVNGSTGSVSVQPTLVSGTNIKTINDESILGSGNITISGGGGISDGDKGDITVSASGATWTIDNGVVTDAKVASGIDAAKIADGTVSNAEYQYLGGVTSDIQTQLDSKVDENAAITGATKTKITFDAKGLVTAGADATTADIADSADKRYVTDAQATVIGNTSGTNTGDNATNSQYSGLEASKQDTLVSGTNIKTINSTSLLGSGDIVIGGGSPSGVSGAIQFSDGSAFASDATNLFWDDTNNRLGVGTNTPSSALDVASDAKINGLTVGLGGGAITSNTAFGSGTLAANTTGNSNTAVGAFALQNNNTGFFNGAVGQQALERNTSGANNNAFGFRALRLNTTGANNMAIGQSALLNNTASNNTAVGYEAATSNTTATGITAIGYQALRLSTGANNTAVGYQAGDNITTGAGNVCIGSGAEPQNATDSNKFVVGTAAVNAGAVTTETITADTTWTVRINGANYKIPMLAL